MPMKENGGSNWVVTSKLAGTLHGCVLPVTRGTFGSVSFPKILVFHLYDFCILHKRLSLSLYYDPVDIFNSIL